MDIIKLTCVAIDDMEDYFTVSLSYSSNDLSVTTGGNLNFVTEDASRYEIGKDYGLDLNEIVY